MSHQWEPEQTIEPPMALQLIKEQFPELSPLKAPLSQEIQREYDRLINLIASIRKTMAT
jgi:hypothetical protein